VVAPETAKPHHDGQVSHTRLGNIFAGDSLELKSTEADLRDTVDHGYGRRGCPGFANLVSHARAA